MVALLVVFAATGCGLFKKKPKPTKDGAELVGIIEMVNPEQNYVLIRCEYALEASAGQELIAVDATGAQSKLSLSPERKGRYLTADVKSGQPKVTNLVLMYRKKDLPSSGTAVMNTGETSTATATATTPVPVGLPGADAGNLGAMGGTPASPATNAPMFGPAPIPKYVPQEEPLLPTNQSPRPTMPKSTEPPLPAGVGAGANSGGGGLDLEPVVR